MHILVYEYLTGGGLNGNPPAALIVEGERMVIALIRDLLLIPGVTVTVLRDTRLAPYPRPDDRLQVLWIQPDEAPEERLARALDTVDAVWPIAPETHGCLASICQRIEAHGTCLLTTPATGVALTASKQKTLDRLEQCGIPVVPTRDLESLRLHEAWDYPWVFKIDDGVGCEDTVIIRGPEDRDRFMANKFNGAWLAQPLLNGDALSLSGLFHKGEGRLLCCNHQNIRQSEAGFQLLGISVNARPDLEGILGDLLDRVAQAIPTLWGFAGIDLLFGPHGPKVLEVNPRLTSAYPGIRRAKSWNPAALVLDLAQNHVLPSLPSIQPGMTVELDWSLT